MKIFEAWDTSYEKYSHLLEAAMKAERRAGWAAALEWILEMFDANLGLTEYNKIFDVVKMIREELK